MNFAIYMVGRRRDRCNLSHIKHHLTRIRVMNAICIISPVYTGMRDECCYTSYESVNYEALAVSGRECLSYPE